MNRSERFVVVLLGLAVAFTVVGVLFVPPEPYLELLFLAPAVGVSFLVAYWVAYRR
jgi:hypothetical protein